MTSPFSKSSKTIPSSRVTPESIYSDRRTIIKSLGMGLGASTLSPSIQAGIFDSIFGKKKASSPAQQKDLPYEKDKLPEGLTLTPESKALSHNNFYEFGTGKTDPQQNSQNLTLEPWTIEISGQVKKRATVDVWDLMHSSTLEERIYRMRCVEAWSMVIPWVGIPLGKFLARFEPTSKAKYVAFETLYRPAEMPGQRSRFNGGGIDYPYVEGLRIDEAMHPLSLLTLGAYGKTLAPQNGAPVRLITPWKYGFKGIKSIVKIRFTEKKPPTTWNLLARREYGFYANVNPAVDHPRWSQASERFIGEGGILNVSRQATLPFNGYADEVASLYKGMDLAKNY